MINDELCKIVKHELYKMILLNSKYPGFVRDNIPHIRNPFICPIDVGDMKRGIG